MAEKVKTRDVVNPFAHMDAAEKRKKGVVEKAKPKWYDWRQYLGSYDSASKSPAPSKSKPKSVNWVVNPKTGKPERQDLK